MTNSQFLLVVGVVTAAVGSGVISRRIVRSTAAGKHAYNAKSKKDNN